MTVLDSYKTLVDTVINQDEGGWKLTPASESDPSGGWTFAGATKDAFLAWYDKYDNKLSQPRPSESYSDMAHYVAENYENVKQEVYQFYMDEYTERLKLRGTPYTSTITPALLSCAVNCGVETAVELYNSVQGNNKLFLNAWHHHYIDLVVNNAKAWHDYAKALAALPSNGDAIVIPPVAPKTFRAPNAGGWFNRVEKYRS